MKKLFNSYAYYDYWANDALFTIVLQLSQLQQKQEMKSSFPSIHKTCFHLLDAYSIWWQRLQKEVKIIVPSVVSDFSIEIIVNQILLLNKQWIQFVETTSDENFENMVTYKNSKADSFQTPVNKILLHLFNHGTYHRGQLVTMFRQLGLDTIPQTDYIFYTRC